MDWQNSDADDEATEQFQPIADANAEAMATEEVGWISRLRARFTGAQARRTYTTERLIALSRAIERHPESPANYVVRGELFLEIGQQARAAEDFQMALVLAEAQFANDDWGLVSQALQDRALAGLSRIP